MKTSGGYIALISVILISSIILAVTLETSYAVYFSRFNISASEEKAESFILARSCLEVSLVRLAQNPDYQPTAKGDQIPVDQNICEIVLVSNDAPSNLIVKTKADFVKAITNIEATVKLTNDSISILSFKETSNH